MPRRVVRDASGGRLKLLSSIELMVEWGGETQPVNMYVAGNEEPVLLGMNALGRCKAWREEMMRAMDRWDREAPTVRSLRRELIPPRCSRFVPGWTQMGTAEAKQGRSAGGYHKCYAGHI